MMLADSSMASEMFVSDSRAAQVRDADHHDRIVLGVSRWDSPPPAPSRNWNYLLQLGLLVAVLLIVFGVRMSG
jgi:hypothetical protein